MARRGHRRRVRLLGFLRCLRQFIAVDRRLRDGLICAHRNLPIEQRFCFPESHTRKLGPRAGMRVRHPIYGRGTVLGVEGRGPGQKLRIRFDDAGVKKIVVRYANLELG